MKYYKINVNGNTYEVSVEETNGFTQPSMASQPALSPAPAVSAAATPAPAAAPEKPAAPAQGGTAGSVKVNSPMPGKIVSVKANIGDAVKKGDVILILEAMKMENEIVAPSDGKIASINVTAGQSVTAGDILATLN